MLDPARLRLLLDAGRNLVSELDLDEVLERLLETALEVTGARYAAVGVLDERRTRLARFLTRGFDPATEAAVGARPEGHGILGLVIDTARPLRLDDLGNHEASFGFPPGHPPMRSFLGVPVLVGGQAWGNLYLTEKAGGFDADDEEAAVILADWAGTAVATAQSFRAERLHRSLEAAEAERRRWARELHDETLQGLAALKVTLAGISHLDDTERIHAVVGRARTQVADEIDNLRALIHELRPSALDDLGLVPALGALGRQTSARFGVAVTVQALGDRPARLDDTLETVVYRAAQEALTNVGKHAQAGRAEVLLTVSEDALRLTVRDDGRGFDPGIRSGGLGIVGMHERVSMVGGSIDIERSGGWTGVHIEIPLHHEAALAS